MEKDFRLAKKIVWAISAILAVFPIMQIVRIQSEAASSLMWGLSLSRLILVFGIFLAGLVFGGMAVFGNRLEEKFPWLAASTAEIISNRFSYIFIGAVFFLWLGFGAHAFEDWQEFYTRLRPVIQYFAIILSLWTFHFFIIGKNMVKSPQKSGIFGWGQFFSVLLIFIAFLMVWGFIGITRIGITPGYPYWGEAGTILFGYQFVLSLVTAFLITTIFKKLFNNHSVRFDVVVFLLLWMGAGVLWNLTDVGHNFFAPRAFGQPYFPYSDAATYDVNAYSILIGKGISFAQYTYRPMYIAFLALLHLFSGPDFSILVGIQVAILALIVPGLYLVGREVHSRTLGFLVAFMGLVSQLNSFVANEFVRVSNAKLLLTEFPTAVILVYTAFFFISGIKKESQKRVVIAFGLLAVGFLIRLHVAVVMVALLVILFAIYPKPKAQFRNAVSLLGVTFMIVFPWMLRNYVAVGSFSLDPGRFNLLLDERWKLDQEGLEGNLFDLSNSSKIYKPASLAVEASVDEIQVGIDSLKEMLAHFLHNEVMSVMGLPDSIRFLTGRNYYQNEYNLTGQWAGEVSTTGKIYIAANLLILALGIWSAYQKGKFLGLVPLVIQLSYNGANALVRTSGWRYLTPTEWVMILYYGLGLLQLIILLRSLVIPAADTNQEEIPVRHQLAGFTIGNLLKGGAGFVLLSVIVSFGPLLVKDQFPPLSNPDRQAYVEEIANYSELTQEQLETFLSSKQSVLLVGKVLYPRYYYPNDGIFHYRSEVVDYSRVEFTLISNASQKSRFAISRSRNDLEHEMDVVIVGCRSEGGYVDALLVYPLDGDANNVLLRSTGWDSACPLSAP